MTGLTHHKIRRATVDFQFNGAIDGFSFQQEVRDWFDEFVAKLDEEFKNISTEQVIQIGVLQLDVSLEGRDWREQASEEIIRQLKDRFHLMRTGQVSASGFTETTTIRQFEESVLHYLEYGYLPWPSSGLSAVQWNEQLNLLIGRNGTTFTNALIRILLRSASALQRFIQLVPTESLLQFIRTEGSYRSPYQEKFIDDLTVLVKMNLFRQDPSLTRVVYRALLLSYSPEHDSVSIEQEVLDILQQKLADQVGLKERFKKIAFQSPGFILLKKSIVIASRSSRDKRTTSKSTKDSHRIQESDGLPDQVPTNELTSSDESIFIANAGLVIVVPFLPGLFDTLGVARNGIIQDEANAVGVTHFLATGVSEIQEYELPLAKILCGIPVEKPVDVNAIRFNKRMRTETTRVLSSVIEHWSILQNTSVSGLRESFLKRNGKLHFNGRDWVLQVEQQPYDMLLQHLPWSISMIKLSWMQYMLKTEWVY